MFGLEILICLALLLYLFYRWSTSTFNTFEERKIPYEKPIPLFGNGLSFIVQRESLHKKLMNLYRRKKQQKIYGFYNFRSPFFIVNDPDLVKKIAVKDFDSFTNHQRIFNADADPLLRGILTVMKDQRWRNMRNTVTPVFTGAKMRSMFTLMIECFEEAIKYLDINLELGKRSFEIEVKDFFTRLSNDLIATTAFGLKTNSFRDKENEFFCIGQSMSKARGLQALKFMLYNMAPKIFELLGLKIFDKERTDYFIKLVVDTMKYREEHNIVRPDMIQLLMEAKRESEFQWSTEDLVAQCFIFFFAAYENNAILLCTTCYELADNQDIQHRLYEEIMEANEHLNGKTIDYDTLKNMKYLDMVVQETLRKWSIAAMIDRECGKDYRVIDDDGKFICDLKQGDRIWIQIIGFHYDEDYFENPEIFDPERFSDANKNRIKPFTYSPFGVGPRSCIGNRYALMQAKAMIYYLLKDFKVDRSPKLCKNLMDDIRGFTIAPESGFWFKLTKRS